ncbi:MAG: hypothetical protein HY697_01470 [Deltaproteobacteria bacterium]|nr:hypothetical protein [Deltaproteobacteria bacterium]
MDNLSQRIKEKEMVVLESGSMIQWLAGMGAIALAIIGLAGILSAWMASIATIAIGVALLFEGGLTGARYYNLIAERPERTPGLLEFSGLTAEFFGGACGVVLGILALLGIFPMTLVPIAAIVYGSALLLESGMNSSINELYVAKACDREEARQVARAAVRSLSGVQALIGMGSLILGIMGVIGVFPLVLSLVAMLGFGFSHLLSGAAVSGRMLSALHCR